MRFTTRDDNALGKAIEYAIVATFIAISIGLTLTWINAS